MDGFFHGAVADIVSTDQAEFANHLLHGPTALQYRDVIVSSGVAPGTFERTCRGEAHEKAPRRSQAAEHIRFVRREDRCGCPVPSGEQQTDSYHECRRHEEIENNEPPPGYQDAYRLP